MFSPLCCDFINSQEFFFVNLFISKKVNGCLKNTFFAKHSEIVTWKTFVYNLKLQISSARLRGRETSTRPHAAKLVLVPVLVLVSKALYYPLQSQITTICATSCRLYMFFLSWSLNDSRSNMRIVLNYVRKTRGFDKN